MVDTSNKRGFITTLGDVFMMMMVNNKILKLSMNVVQEDLMNLEVK